MYHRGTIMLKGFEYLASLKAWDGASKVSLDKIRIAAELLGSPQDKIKTIHVAGTNGKGSVSASIASILGAAGYSVGLYTSPYIISVNEMIVIDGYPISDDELNSILIQIEDICLKNLIILTLHEVLTLAAFIAFQDLDYAVIEVGLGGRLDSSNIIKSPEVSIITSIAMDHEAILGNSLAKIAFEKAGIIKEGRVSISGLLNPDAAEVIKQEALRNKSSLYSLGENFYVDARENQEYEFSFKSKLRFKPNLAGAYQVENSALALACCDLLEINNDAKLLGLQNVLWPARLQTLNIFGKKSLIDAAHNPAGVLSLMSFLDSQNMQYSAVFSALATKDWKTMIQSAKGRFVHWDIVQMNHPQACDVNLIKEYLIENGEKVFIHHSVSELENNFKNLENPVIFGSIYFLAEILASANWTFPRLWKRLGDYGK